jgi:hypothetical protein
VSLGGHLVWDGGGEGRIVSLHGDGVALVSTMASPPGSRPVALLMEEPRAKVRMKVHACRALGDGTFRIEGRLIDVTRELRRRLAGMAPGDDAE